VGQHVKINYKLSTVYDHYNWTRTICAMFGTSQTWTTNISTRKVITGCWK
jgi:phosphatidylinositol-3-phosphatase